MPNILVPVDFSQTAQDALLYALELGAVLKKEVLVVHIFSGSFALDEPLLFSPQKGHQEVVQERLDEFVEYTRKAPALSEAGRKVPVATEAFHGLVEEQINKRSQKQDVDLIIMGATGLHGLSGKLFGSTTETVARKAHSPVVLIPSGYRFKAIENLLFASDATGPEEPMLAWIVLLANQFSSNLLVVHYFDPENPQDQTNALEQQFSDAFKGHLAQGVSFAFHALPAQGSISDAISVYGREHQVDLLAMVARKRSFWDKLFKPSQTKKIALHLKIPLMVFHLDD